MSFEDIQVVIVAGGRGERMRPWTDRIPKPMIPVAGKPILERQLDWLKKSGVRNVVMCLGYKAQAVMDHFGDASRWGLRLSYHVESEPRGTAGCVRDAWPRGLGELLVVYGDIFADIDLRALLASHHGNGGSATLVLAETDHPYDSDLVRLEGDIITGFYRARPGEACDHLACAALWVVTDRLVELIPASGVCDFGRDVFPLALDRGEKLVGYRTAEVIADLGTPERLAAFEKSWGSRQP